MEKLSWIVVVLQVFIVLGAPQNESSVFYSSGSYGDKKLELNEYDSTHSSHGSDYLKHLISNPFWHSTLKNDSTCKKHMDIVLKEAEALNFWALKMLDASAKLPSGILSGNLNQFGDFDECLSVQGTDQHETIKGKYCLANVNIQKVDPTNKKLKVLDDSIHSHRFITNNLSDPGHRIPRLETFNWAICMPSSCTGQEIETAIRNYLSLYPANNNFRFDVKVNHETCYVQEPKPYSIVQLLVMCLFAVILILATYEMFFDLDNSIIGSPNIKKLIKCFSLKKNINALLQTNSKDDIKCLHGARFLNAIALVLSHKQISLLFNPIFNRTAMTEGFGKTWTMIGRSAILYTDSFILISGLLASYTIIKDLDAKKKFNFKDRIVNRFIRFIPNLFGIIFFCTFIMDDMSSGPQWGLVVNKYTDLCKKNMWRNFLFIHNFFGFENMCLTHTHQLGIDMQLFLVSPIFIYSLWKFPKLGTLLVMVASAVSTWLRYDVTYRESLSTILYYGISVERLWKTANMSYILPSHRLTVYLMGIFLGYYLQRGGRKVQLNRFQLIAGWIIAVSAGLISMFAFFKVASPEYKYDPTEAAIFNAFAPALWTVFLAWAILACSAGYGGFFNDFLCWKYFTVFTKISYAVYLTQFPVFFYGIGTMRLPHYFGVMSLFDIVEFIVILISSIVLTLTFDIPFQEIKKTFKFNSIENSINEKPERKKEKEDIGKERLENIDDDVKLSNTRKRLQPFGT